MTKIAKRMPAVFFGHGSPMNALTRNRYTEAWRHIGASVPRPAAILVISAHWYTPDLAVTAMRQPRTIHDFAGFPRALYEVQYPAAGAPQLAERVRKLLQPLDVRLDHSWGLDHGTWSVLVHAFPQAEVPVIQLSMDATKPASFHYAMGQRLARLRDEGVLIIGSGNIVHNLYVLQMEENAAPYDWAVRFSDRVRGLIERGEHAPLLSYEQMGEDARLSVPTPEHFLPLLYVLGTQQAVEPVRFFAVGIDLSSISMLTVAIGME